MLLVLRPSDLVILQVSENSGRWLGCSPLALLGQPVAAAVGENGQARLRELLRTEPTEHNPVYLFTLEARGATPPLDVIVHTTGGVAVGKPLSMTHGALRGPSIMYTEYLQNMGVKAALTMPIQRDGELWGLIACHHYAAPSSVPYNVRAACEFFAQVVSLQHNAIEDREQLLYRLQLEGVHQQLVAAAAARERGFEAMTDGIPTLLDAMDAGGAAIYYRRSWWRVGKTPSEPQLEALVEWLYSRRELASKASSVYATDALARDYPSAEAFADVGSGLLAVLLSLTHRSVLLWFRPETIQTVNWGGNPHEKPTVPGPHGPRLTPRKSFEIFVESVLWRSLPWKPVLRAGAQDFIGKAWMTVESLTRAVENAVDRWVMAQELRASDARLRAALDQAQRAVRSRDELASLVSHDLKNPLNAMMLGAALLEDEVGEEGLVILKRMARQGQRMNKMIDELIDAAQLHAGMPLALALQETDLVQLTRSVAEEYLYTAPDHRIEIRAATESLVGTWDPKRLDRVVNNLLSNAVKYSPGGGSVQVELANAHDGDTLWALLRITDEGIGIGADDQVRVFQWYSRGDNALRTTIQGTGIGLAGARDIVEQHGGTISVESEEGKGSTFTVRLPTAPPRKL